MTTKRTRPELARSVARLVTRAEEYGEGTVLATRQALGFVELAQTDLEALAFSLRERLKAIDLPKWYDERAQTASRPRGLTG